jgi:hypothetical protein
VNISVFFYYIGVTSHWKCTILQRTSPFQTARPKFDFGINLAAGRRVNNLQVSRLSTPRRTEESFNV